MNNFNGQERHKNELETFHSEIEQFVQNEAVQNKTVHFQFQKREGRPVFNSKELIDEDRLWNEKVKQMQLIDIEKLDLEELEKIRLSIEKDFKEYKQRVYDDGNSSRATFVEWFSNRLNPILIYVGMKLEEQKEGKNTAK